jgi:hypothetical protein
MTTGELKNWLADRLRMRGPASTNLDLRGDEAPYERPLQLWKTAEGNFHHEFLRAVLALVEEAAAEPWDPGSFDQLGRLIEAGRIHEATGILEAVAHSKRLLTIQEGAQLRMQALRTLLALGWTGSLEFWLTQAVELGARWPGLIFKGLARHSIEDAFARLPRLAIDAKAMQQVLDLFPGLMRDQNLHLFYLKELSRSAIGKLPLESAALLREWFALRNIPLPAAVNIINFSLESAIAQFLGGKIVPQTYEAALVGNAEPELAYAY